MHSRQGDIYWIEAEDFSHSNFAVKADKETQAVAVMAAAEASGGMLVVSFQKPDFFLEYEFREDRDGSWPYQVWLRYATTCPSTRLITNCNNQEAGNVMLAETDDFFRKYRWEKIADIRVPKGNHALKLILKTGVIHPDVLILTPDEQPISSGRIEELIKNNLKSAPLAAEQVNQNRLWLETSRNGVPLGGIGTGKIELCQDGGFANVSINNNQDAPIASLPGSFFLYREQISSAAPVIRWLEQTGRSEYEIKNLTYDGLYPFANVSYSDPALAAQIALEAFAPIIPYNTNDSSLPAALFAFTLSNSSKDIISAAIGFSWENAIGCGGLGVKPEYGPGKALRADGQPFWAWNDRTGNDQEILTTQSGKGLRFFAPNDHGYGSSFGEYALLCVNAPDLNITTTRSYNVEKDLPALIKRISDEIPPDLSDQPGQENSIHTAGIVWANVSLKPGESSRITFCLAWHFVCFKDRFGRDWSVNYANRFKSAAAVADYAVHNNNRLAEGSRQVNERIMRSSLPEWLSRKIVNDLFPITTCTWFEKSGRFSVNESPTSMHGCLGTLDQRTASQGVYTALFPEFDKTELSLFAEFQHDNGLIPHELGLGCIEKPQHIGCQWPDLICSFIIETLRLIHATGDMSFARGIYARVPKAIEWALGIDDDQDGVPDMKPGRGNTYDTSEWPGCSAFVGSLWIAALRAAADMARLAGRHEDIPRYNAVAEKAIATVEQKLWNGAFFRNFSCDNAGRTDAENCLLPQVAGEWALDLLDLPQGLSATKVRSALREVYRRNIQGLNVRFKGPADETTPDGDPAWVGAAFLQYSWLYFGALAAYRGLTKEALYSWRQSYEQAWQINKQPWKTRLCGFALSGKFNGLPWYMTNTASWDILTALSGFAYSVPDKWLRINPHLPASWRDSESDDLRLSCPLFGTGFWLDLDYVGRPDMMQFKIKVDKLFHDLPCFRIFRTSLPENTKLKMIKIDGHEPSAPQYDSGSGRLSFDFLLSDKETNVEISFENEV